MLKKKERGGEHDTGLKVNENERGCSVYEHLAHSQAIFQDCKTWARSSALRDWRANCCPTSALNHKSPVPETFFTDPGQGERMGSPELACNCPQSTNNWYTQLKPQMGLFGPLIFGGESQLQLVFHCL